jgi:hypothetical protein
MTGRALYKVFVADTSFRAESLHIFARAGRNKSSTKLDALTRSRQACGHNP